HLEIPAPGGALDKVGSRADIVDDGPLEPGHDDAGLALLGVEDRLPWIQHVAELPEDGLQQEKHKGISLLPTSPSIELAQEKHMLVHDMYCISLIHRTLLDRLDQFWDVTPQELLVA
uniref:Uncharacterized protein n=1 Tax=Triticum urartu TaxID=4572 RepID=A0A8R7QHI6_TRIUA